MRASFPTKEKGRSVQERPSHNIFVDNCFTTSRAIMGQIARLINSGFGFVCMDSIKGILSMDYATRRAAALEILTTSETLTRKAGSFLGQCVADECPLSERQETWLGQLASRAGVEWEAA